LRRLSRALQPAYPSEDDALRLLTSLLRVYSPSGRERPASELAAREALNLGYDEAWVDDTGSFHAERGGGPRVLLAGHIDTVPGYIEVRVEDGFVWGRGAVDAKGPLVSFLLAGAMVRGCRVRVSGLAGEEADSPGAKALVDSHERFDHALIGEPTGLAIAIGYRGSSLLKIECRARGGHSSSPEVGESALDKILGAAGSVSGGGVSASIVELTARGPARNMLPTEAKALVDVRFAERYSLTLPGGCSARALSFTPPVRVKPQTPVVRALQRALLSMGVKPRIVVKRGTSDMNILYPRVADSMAAFGPGDPRLSHTPYEKIRVSEVVAAARVIASALEWLCSEGRL
jgi:LysW-gamma-L-lysine carboxypeptidase